MVEGWENDQDLEEIFVAKDRDLVRKLSVVLKKSKRRERDIDKIADKLQMEIDMQTEYLEAMIGNIEKSEMFDNDHTPRTIDDSVF